MVKRILRFLKRLILSKTKAKIEKTQNVTIGKHVYGDYKIWDWEHRAELQIGNFCSIGQNVEFYLGGNHRSDWVTTYPFPAFYNYWKNAEGINDFSVTKGNIVIGSDVWIGNNVTILSGVTIGHGAIIGANAIVTKNIPPYAIAVGNPARIIKSRFSEDIIDNLLALKWWDLDDEIISELSIYLCQPDIELFIEKATQLKQIS